MTPCSSCSNPLVCSDLGTCYSHSPQFKVPLAMTPRTDAAEDRRHLSPTKNTIPADFKFIKFIKPLDESLD